MVERPDITLNGKSLGLVDNRIYINKITEARPNYNINAVPRGNHVGQHFLFADRGYIEIGVEIAILEKDLAEHAMILQYVNQWCAEGGRLELNYRPNQHADVVCTSFPDIASITDWTRNRYRITFRAYSVPYWVNNVPNTVSASASGDYTLFAGGTAETPLEMRLTASGAVNTVKISSANGSFIEFTELGMQDGDVFTLYHENGVLYAKNGDANLLNKRTTDSYDEVMLKAGNNALALTVDGECSTDLIAQGRWM